MSQCFASLLLLVSFTSAVLSSTIDEEQQLMRRLLSEPTAMPTKSPVSTDCTVLNGVDPNNPSDVDMALVNTASGEYKIDLVGSDTNLDENEAVDFCEAKFGTGSKPVTPTTADIFDAMVHLCESLGNNNECYMGLYREDYNGDKLECDEWKGNDAVFTTSSNSINTNYASWALNNPSCPWDSAHVNYDTASNADKKHCVTYRTNTNNLRTVPCLWSTLHIICTYGTTCDPNASI